MKQKSLTKNALFTIIKAFMNIIFPIISFPYASRILLPEGTGRVNFANSFIEYFVMFAQLGIGWYAAREAARVREDKHKLNKLCREILTINLFSTLIAYIALFISIFTIPKFSDYRLLIIICSAKVLFTTIGINWVFTAYEEFGYITARQTLFQIISLALLFLFVKTKDDYLIYAGIGVFANVGSNIFNLIYARKFINVFEKTPLDLKKHLKPVLTFFGISIAGRINIALDALMLGFMLNDAAVGFYSAAVKINRLVKEMITSAICSFMPRSSFYLENNQMSEYKAVVSKVCNATFFFCMPAALGMFFLSEPLIILFSGNLFLPAAPSMKILSISLIGSCANSFLGNLIITPQRKEKFTLIAQIIAAASNITLNAMLITRLEVFGAAIATTIVEFILPLMLLFPSFKYLKSKANIIGIMQALLGSLCMYASIYFACTPIQNNFLKILASVGIGSTVYALAEIILQNKTAKTILSLLFKKLKIVPKKIEKK